MKHFHNKQFFAALAVAFIFCQPAQAETTDWMKGTDSLRFARKLGAGGDIVTGMECKDSGQASLDYDSALVRLTYSRNVKHTGWVISGWNNLPSFKKYFADRGYKMVSQTMFVRQKSGLRLYCGIFYR